MIAHAATPASTDWADTDWRQRGWLVPMLGLVERLHDDGMPRAAAFNALWPEPRPRSCAGMPLHFVETPGTLSAMEYEHRIHVSGAIGLMAGWHDAFNALSWLTYPATKAVLNATHAGAARHGAGAGRGPRRDVATLLDESGVLAACADPDLAQLLTGFRWKDLFWRQRAAFASRISCHVLGHGLQQQLLRPYRGVTGKALVITVATAFFDQAPDLQTRELDRLAARLLTGPAAPQSPTALTPLPLLGIPGWWPPNSAASYYDDIAYFRPGRRAPGA